MSRRHFLTIPILIFFLCMLSFPQTVFAGASYGLLLWFRHVLPTLLPYMVLINILIRTPALHWICHITSPFLCPLLGTSYYGTFAVLTGFLCGYPMGAKTASDLLDAQKISRSEASYLLSFCNNTSPAFILSYVVIQNLKKDSISIPFLLILTLTPLMMSFVFRLFYRAKDHIHPFSHMMQVSSSTASQSENLSGNYLYHECIRIHHKGRWIYDDVLCPDSTACVCSSRQYSLPSSVFQPGDQHRNPTACVIRTVYLP